MSLIALTPYRKLHDYEEAVRRAGGQPRVVDMRRDRPIDVIAGVSGVLLPGGGDVDPMHYGEPPHPTFDAAETGRDAYELELVQRALDLDLPVLAICRGIQVLNVARGGTLVQDIPDLIPEAGNHVLREPPFAIAHDVRVTEHSLLARLLRDRLAGGPENGRLGHRGRHHPRTGDGERVRDPMAPQRRRPPGGRGRGSPACRPSP